MQNIYSQRLPKSIVTQNAIYDRCPDGDTQLETSFMAQHGSQRRRALPPAPPPPPPQTAANGIGASEKRRRSRHGVCPPISSMVAKMKSGRLFARNCTTPATTTSTVLMEDTPPSNAPVPAARGQKKREAPLEGSPKAGSVDSDDAAMPDLQANSRVNFTLTQKILTCAPFLFTL